MLNSSPTDAIDYISQPEIRNRSNVLGKFGGREVFRIFLAIFKGGR